MIPLEDHAGDVVAKALRGWRLAPADVASAAGLSGVVWSTILDGGADGEVYSAIAPHLKLHAPSLRALADGAWRPRPVTIAWMRQINLPYEEMRVNVYLAWDPESREAVVFDASGDASPIIAAAEELDLRVRLVLLTHEHDDHVDGAEQLERHYGLAAAISRRASRREFAGFDDDQVWRVGALGIRALPTPGHSPGGTTFLVEGPGARVAVVGDAVFAASLGGSRDAFPQAVATVRSNLMTLPPATFLAPGHGPMTSVAEEAVNNPFLASSAGLRF